MGTNGRAMGTRWYETLDESNVLLGAADLTASKAGEHGEQISPFFLIGPKDKPNEADAQELISHYATGSYYDSPSDDLIREELKNPNHYVREICRKILALAPAKRYLNLSSH